MIVAGRPSLPGVKQAGIATPVVMSGTGPDPVQAGRVARLAHPGGNFTGITLQHPELDPKRPTARTLPKVNAMLGRGSREERSARVVVAPSVVDATLRKTAR